MRSALRAQIRARPLVWFFVLAFLLTWVGWVPVALYSHGLIPVTVPFGYLAGVGPGVAALIVLRACHGPDGTRRLGRALLDWRVPLRWYAIALLVPAAVWAAAAALDDTGGGLDPAMAPMFLWYLVQAIPEEAGWRGVALPRLQQHHTALTASLVLGGLWGLWHLPLLLTAGTAMAAYPMGPYLLETMAIAVVYTWLYNATQGSLIIPILFHAAWNTLPAFSTTRSALTVAIATLVVIRHGPRRLGRDHQQDGSGSFDPHPSAGSRRTIRAVHPQGVRHGGH